MSDRDQYPAGVPCFVDTLVPDVEASKRFYCAVFGWEFTGPGAMPDDPSGEYFVARLRGRDVAAVGTRPADSGSGEEGSSGWNTYVAVGSADEGGAGGGPRPGDGGSGEEASSGWNTSVAVSSADEAAAEALALGGVVLVEPFDAPPAGRMAGIGIGRQT